MKQFSKVLTLIIFSLLFINLSAQDDEFSDDPVAKSSDDDRKFRLGLQLSPHISWMSPNTDKYSSTGKKFSFTYGLATEFFLAKNYLVATGIFIANLGGELSFKGVYLDNNGVNIPSGVQQTYSIKYIEIPLTLKLRTNEIGYMTYYGQFGLKLGGKFKSTSDLTYTDISNTPTVKDKNTASDIFFMNTYLVIGAGAEYNITGNTNLMIGLTYNNGFVNQLDKKANVLDAGGDAIINTNGEPVMSSKDASANLSYFALNIGFFF